MRRRDLLALAGSGLVAATSGPAWAGSLDKYQWNRRLLLVFAPVRPHPNLMVQRQRLKEAAAGLEERELTVVEAVQDMVYVDGRTAIELNAKALRAEYGIEIINFAVVLIGKDGGEKLRQDEPLTMEALFETVDAMPMRQQEMRQKGQKA